MEDVKCIFCGRRRVIQTSWTDANSGRMFLSCLSNGCNQFTWVDPLMCSRAVQIIPGLLKKVNKLEARLQTRNERERKLWICLAASWCIIVSMWFAI
ncbi:DNA topoisomerase 3-alpha [Camellia lanceoleosa]|uniref:DNA topoisomerase 3-alpha n=1 Tax=Camellia lanceoleosa TaxID=1840588 RepID=A0ACC0I430_9ERIC|nr:DNA topoisomerase 3-alpha [Camellia lanceoleosa]